MKYIRTKDGIYGIDQPIQPERELQIKWIDDHCFETSWKTKPYEWKQADTIEELCDCFIKVKRKKGCKDFILKHDHKDLPLLKQQAVKYLNSPVYGAIHVENKGLIYVAKMNDKGELELL